jgi:hypothetical protein
MKFTTLLIALMLPAVARAIVPLGTSDDPMFVSCSLGQGGTTPITMTSTFTITGTDGSGVSLITSGGITSAGTITGAALAGAGSAITGLTPANVSAGVLPSNVVASSVAIGAVGNAQISAVAPGKITAGALGAGVIASSMAVGSVPDAAIVAVSGSKVSGNISGNAANITGNLAASQVAAGSLGAGVIASSIALNSVGTGQIAALAVTDAKINSMAASKLTGHLTFESNTLAGIQAIAFGAAGIPTYCTDCATSAVCVSTGALAGQVSDIGDRTAACQ